MSFANFGELKAAIATWLVRTDQTTDIPDFVRLCEAHFHKKLRLKEMETVDATLSIDGELVTQPTGLLNIKSLWLDRSPPLPLEPIAPAQRARKKMTAEIGPPSFYCRVGEKIAFYPVPDATYTGKITYGAAFTSLSDDADTNHILTNYPDVYLFGSLTMSMSKLGSKRSAAATWPVLYKEALYDLRKSDLMDRFSGGPMERSARAVA